MCTLRAAGRNFEVDRFLEKSSLRTTSVWRRGKPKFQKWPNRGKMTFSGFNITVSNASWSSLSRQASGAIRFIKKNRNELKRLSRFQGLQYFQLDFPLDLRIGPKVAVQGEYFPQALVKEAGAIGLGLAFSIYPNGSGKWWKRLRSPVGPVAKKRKAP